MIDLQIMSKETYFLKKGKDKLCVNKDELRYLRNDITTMLNIE